jgi:hypothetical protein
MAKGDSTGNTQKTTPTRDQVHDYQSHVDDVLIKSYSILSFMADAALAMHEAGGDTTTKEEDSGWGAKYILSDVAAELKQLSELKVDGTKPAEG